MCYELRNRLGHKRTGKLLPNFFLLHNHSMRVRRTLNNGFMFHFRQIYKLWHFWNGLRQLWRSHWIVQYAAIACAALTWDLKWENKHAIVSPQNSQTLHFRFPHSKCLIKLWNSFRADNGSPFRISFRFEFPHYTTLRRSFLNFTQNWLYEVRTSICHNPKCHNPPPKAAKQKKLQFHLTNYKLVQPSMLTIQWHLPRSKYMHPCTIRESWQTKWD